MLRRSIRVPLGVVAVGAIILAGLAGTLPSTNLIVTERAFPPCPLQNHLGDPSYVFPGDFRHFADEASLENGKVCVYRDGVPGPPYDEINGCGFVGDSGNLAYCARRGNKWYVVVNGHETLECDGLVWGLDSAGTGRYFLCVIKQGSKKRVVTGGQEEPSFDEIAAAALTRDGNRYGYLARNGEQWSCIVDGVRSPLDAEAPTPRPKVPWWQFNFAPDGRRYAFTCQRREQWVVFLDGKELHAGKGVIWSLVSFSPDSKHVAFIRYEQDKSYTVNLDGAESEPYDIVMGPSFSADSRHSGYTAKRGAQWLIVVDGQEMKCQQPLGWQGLTFSPDGRWYACCTEHDHVEGSQVVVGGKDCEQVKVGNYRLYGDYPVFSSDGKHFAYAARRFVVVDGVAGKENGGVEAVRFTPDSRHVVSVHNPGFVVVDRAESRMYDRILYNEHREYIVFDSATTFHTIAIRDGRHYLVEFHICGRWRALLHYLAPWNWCG
jgi:hypothetical protein